MHQIAKDQEFCDNIARSKCNNAAPAHAKEEEEKDSIPSQPRLSRYYLATTSWDVDNTIPVTCSHCNSNLYRRSNPYLIYVCELCRGLMREREEVRVRTRTFRIDGYWLVEYSVMIYQIEVDRCM